MSSLSISGTLQRPDFSTLRKQFDQRIDNDVTTGKISSDDATAIKSAEDDLSKLFDGSSTGSNATTTSFDPSQLKTKVDSFIDGEVKSGKLTSAQADELKSVLQKGRPGGHGGHAGGVGGAHKKSSGLDTLLQSNDDDSSTSSGSTDTSSTDATTLLDKLIKQLQSSTGTDSSQKAKPQFVDYQA